MVICILLDTYPLIGKGTSEGWDLSSEASAKVDTSPIYRMRKLAFYCFILFCIFISFGKVRAMEVFTFEKGLPVIFEARKNTGVVATGFG